MKTLFTGSDKKPPSLFAYALRIAIPVGVVVLLALWLVQNHILQSAVRAELSEHVEDVSARETSQIQNNLGSLKRFANSLATNDLIINGLIDIEGRDSYIPVFFHSLIGPLSNEANISLVDYTGRGIASSNNVMPAVSPDMIEQGYFHIDSHRLLIVEPVLISGYAEGAIVLEYPDTSYEKLFGKFSGDHSLFVTGDNDLVVYSTSSRQARLHTSSTDKTNHGWLQIRSSIEQSNLTVTVGSSFESAFQTMETVQLVQIIGLVSLLFLIIGLLLFSVIIVSRPLSNFTSAISTIRTVDDLNKQLNTQGPREISKIAITFNRMAKWLNSTTVSRDYMDSILSSITEGIITIDSQGKITTFNIGASTIFGYDSEEAVGQNVSLLIPDDERIIHDSYLKYSKIHSKRILDQNRELLGCRKDGSLFPLELVVTPLVIDDENRGFVGTIRDVTERKLIEARLEERSQELKRINSELEHMALYDALTNLGNRNLFTDRLKNLIASSKRNQQKFALLMMDLNKFKQINDTHGHEAGDEVLKQVGRRLKKLGRDADSFFRLGGDEFAAIVTTGVTHEGMQMLANRITQALEQRIEFKGIDLNIGISIGMALFPRHSQDEEELLHLADLAMYHAKRDRLGYLIAEDG